MLANTKEMLLRMLAQYEEAVESYEEADGCRWDAMDALRDSLASDPEVVSSDDLRELLAEIDADHPAVEVIQEELDGRE